MVGAGEMLGLNVGLKVGYFVGPFDKASTFCSASHINEIHVNKRDV
jgi:hypothetical protein